jgi:predicted kinase
MLEMVINRGIPGSGKSTYARKWISEKPNRVIISRDAIRFGLYGVYYGKPIVPDHVTLIQDASIEAALSNEISVIVDDCNIDRWRVGHFIELGKKHGVTARVNLINTELEVALERNLKRERVVPVKVIEKMYKRLQESL